jgi:hypothetical protein
VIDMSWRDIVKLKGKQKNLDKNHNGVIDAQDFYIMNGDETKKAIYNPAAPQHLIDLIGKQQDILEEVGLLVRKIHADEKVSLDELRELGQLNYKQSNEIKLGIISFIETLEGV